MALEGVRVDALISDTPYHLKSIVARFGRTSESDENGTGQRARGRSDAAARLSRGFMGREWDGGDVAQSVAVWRAAYRILKPGGYVLAMSATRTQHRMVSAIEDAGFEIRDLIGWLFAQGFVPNKPLRDGENVRVAPAWEPICIARKPLGEKNVQANLDRHGVGALRVQDCRIGDEVRVAAFNSLDPTHNNNFANPAIREQRLGTQSAPQEYVGRFPKNIILDGSDVVRALFPGRDEDDLSAARFFFCAKATTAERAFDHPTIKPAALMRYLVKLVTRPGAVVLDPFAGTGQTGHAALLEGRRAILIEKEPDYAAGLRARFEGRTLRRRIG